MFPNTLYFHTLHTRSHKHLVLYKLQVFIGSTTVCLPWNAQALVLLSGKTSHFNVQLVIMNVISRIELRSIDYLFMTSFIKVEDKWLSSLGRELKRKI